MYPQYLRAKARQLRTDRGMTLDQIAQRLALPRTTIWYWIADLPARPRVVRRQHYMRANEAMQLKYQLLREAAYKKGTVEFNELCAEPGFRDFVCLYIAEGHK